MILSYNLVNNMNIYLIFPAFTSQPTSLLMYIIFQHPVAFEVSHIHSRPSRMQLCFIWFMCPRLIASALPEDDPVGSKHVVPTLIVILIF
jgi:hypothetical protein